jgi:hypothetical protein
VLVLVLVLVLVPALVSVWVLTPGVVRRAAGAVAFPHRIAWCSR